MHGKYPKCMRNINTVNSLPLAFLSTCFFPQPREEKKRNCLGLEIMSKKGEGKLYEERTEKDDVLDEDAINDTGERNIEKNQKNNQGNNFNDGESKKISKKDIDPKMYNKFKNDGSFLDQVLAMQKKKKVRKLKEVDTADFKKKKTKVEEDEEEKNQKDKEGEKESEIDPEDEREIEIEKEYIEKINKMKEEGFFTDKGIGAGMVK
ncbi:conserved Plasmodium protein, unknown function [Plasmodium ovale wallikeri]|uniref:Uncharacterized protein n=2 Tax=Plasmodium ovale TaxID=36330 RepID=A0A1A8YY44_PLAOA|nr:conserved Plasmodium protein, unknown function [Plasmodium ovale wallikeri]SBT36875.1 conserved Plasmodium protein, unknown function [Plasmodium ovale wallikeri]